MIKLKNTLFFSLFAFSFYVVADNPGEEIVNDADQAVEETVESEVVSDSSSDEESSESDDGVVTLEKVTVTGSRIKRSQVEGATPLIVITKQDMKDNGYRNLTEALQSLPIASAATQNESQVNTFTPNASELDLRRFGPGRVLVLVNGRRMADYPFPYNNSSNFVNTGTIPAGLIDRIEVLTSGSSAVYGSDAVTGVVNIITTKGKDFSEIDVMVGQTEHGEDNIFDFTFTTGGFSGNHSWTVGANMYHIDPMYYNDRSGFSSWEDNPIWSDPSDPQYRSDAVFADYLLGLQKTTGWSPNASGYNEYGLDAVVGNGYDCSDIYPTGFEWNKADYGYSSPPYSYPGSYCVQDYGDDKQTLINERDEYTLMGTYAYNFDNGVTLNARGFYYESESFINSFSRWFRVSNTWTSTPFTHPVDFGYGGPMGTDNFSKYTYTRTFGGQIGPNARRESNYEEDVTDFFIGLEGVYDNGFDWSLGYNTTEYNSAYASSPLTTDVYDWIHGADRGDTTDISDFYQWRGDYIITLHTLSVMHLT
jgi:outer membrane receptor protein involved in Fe transport